MIFGSEFVWYHLFSLTAGNRDLITLPVGIGNALEFDLGHFWLSSEVYHNKHVSNIMPNPLASIQTKRQAKRMQRSEKAPYQPSPTDVEHLGSLLEPSISLTGRSFYTGGTTREPDSCLLDACMLQRSNPRISESTDYLRKVLRSDKCSLKTSTIDDNLPNVSMLTDYPSNASKTTNQPPNVFMSTNYLPNISGSTECPHNVPALTDQCLENKLDNHRYHSTPFSSIGSKTLPSVPQMLNHSPRQLHDDESSPSLTVQSRLLFGHSLPPDNHLQNLDHAKAPAPYVLTSPYHPIPASQHSILYNRVYCAAKRTDDDGGCTPFYNNVQGAGKRSDDASTAICQSINHYCPVKRTDEDRPVKRTGGDDSNVSSYNAVHGPGKRSDDASAASQTINRYCPVKRTDEDRPVKRTGGND